MIWAGLWRKGDFREVGDEISFSIVRYSSSSPKKSPTWKPVEFDERKFSRFRVFRAVRLDETLECWSKEKLKVVPA
jgi:hypothetical protein